MAKIEERDCLASEREASSRREYLANIVLFVVENGGSLNPHSVAERFAREHFEGHIRTVERISGDWATDNRGEWGFSGEVHLAEDDTYRASRYRLAYHFPSASWQFRAPLD